MFDSGVVPIKKRIAVVILAALVLTGCESTAVSLPGNVPPLISPRGTKPSLREEYSDKRLDKAEPKIFMPKSEEGMVVLCHDPKNSGMVKLDGNTIVVSGKIGEGGVKDVKFDVDGEVEFSAAGSEFTARLTAGELGGGFASLHIIWHSGEKKSFRFKLTENGFILPDVSGVAAGNAAAAENPIVQPQNQVAEYIVTGGDPERAREILANVKKLSNEICKGLHSDYDKLRAISQWVSGNIYYDYAAFRAGVPADTLTLDYMLKNHSSVCGGYSNMTAALCAAQGIRCCNVHGAALVGLKCYEEREGEGDYHEWNFAEIGGRVVWLDACWDSHCELHENGVYEESPISYKYFDAGGEYFAQNHRAKYAEYRDYFALSE